MRSDKVTYKLFAVVTNRNIDGSDLIQWHRKRCGKSEHVHSTQKEGLADGQLPSNLFGANGIVGGYGAVFQSESINADCGTAKRTERKQNESTTISSS